jgi:hypothetical protein
MRRHQHIIRRKRSVKFEAKRAEWCTYENFSEMYAHTYEAMVEHGIATKCDTKVKLNKQGEIVEHSEEAFCLPAQYLIQRPDKLVLYLRLVPIPVQQRMGMLVVRYSRVKQMQDHKQRQQPRTHTLQF